MAGVLSERDAGCCVRGQMSDVIIVAANSTGGVTRQTVTMSVSPNVIQTIVVIGPPQGT